MSLIQGQVLKQEALASHEMLNREWLARAREVALEIAHKRGEVCADDVRAALPLPTLAHPSLMGAVFNDRRFRCVGFTKSVRTEARARIIRLYEAQEDL